MCIKAHKTIKTDCFWYPPESNLKQLNRQNCWYEWKLNWAFRIPSLHQWFDFHSTEFTLLSVHVFTFWQLFILLIDHICLFSPFVRSVVVLNIVVWFYVVINKSLVLVVSFSSFGNEFYLPNEKRRKNTFPFVYRNANECFIIFNDILVVSERSFFLLLCLTISTKHWFNSICSFNELCLTNITLFLEKRVFLS